MAKTIEIKKSTIFKLFLSFVIGFGVLYGLQHFGTFSFLEEQTYNPNERVSLTRDISTDANVSTIIFPTYFGKKITTRGNGFKVKDIYFLSGSFHKYSNKSYYYTQATIEDYKYGIYFGLGLFVVIMFFTYVKIRIS
ncbi:hypothetical protein GW796_11345 [archaeon]|nr:hypothetical protein [archaeon]